MVALRALPTAARSHAIALGSLLVTLGMIIAPAADAATGLVRYKSGPIAITQDGTSVWVVNADANSVTRIAAGPDTVVAEIPVGVEPRNLAISTDGSEVWVTNFRSNTVSIVSAGSNSVVATLPTLLGPFGVAMTPDGSKAYVVNQISDSLLTFSTASRTVIDRDIVGHRSRAVAVSSDGTRVMVQQFLGEWRQMLTSFLDGGGGSLSAASLTLATPVPQGDGGFPGVAYAIAIAPGDTTLWIPLLDLNWENGPFKYPGAGELTLTSTMQLVVREVRIGERVEIPERPTGGRRRLNSAGAIAQMPMDVAFTADGQYAYIPCAFSNNVLKIDTGTNPPATLIDIPVGDHPNGIAISPTMDRAYVVNSLSRSVSVINTNTDSVISAVAATRETLPPNVLNGKKLFNTSLGRMSTGARITCAGCHPDAGPDGFTWDFTQFGAGLRNTRSPRVFPMMAPLLSAGNWDEVQDAEWSIENVHHGEGLADGPEPPSVGTPNAGRSHDLDDIAAYLASLGIRDESPFRNPDQSLTPSAQAGKAAFVKAECPACHPEPLFTDKVRHDVGTYLMEENETGCSACHESALSPMTSPHGRASAGPTVPSGYLGFVTPSLCSVYDTDPYLHNGLARYLQAVFGALNWHDQHGRTSILSTTERFDLITYVRSIVRGREDVTAPRLEFARAIGLTEVIVRFLEPVDPGSATNISHYTIDNGVAVLSASLDPFSTFMGRDGLTVHLFTTPHASGQNYTVTVRGLQDMSLNANTIPFPGISASYTCENEATFTFSNVDSLYTSRLGRDTYVDAGEPTLNFGRSTDLSVGSNGSVKRAMVMVDFYPMLSTMIADSGDIVSAKLRLRLRDQASSEPVTIYAYRLLKYFVEGSGGEVYGNPYPNQTNWESARGGVLSWGAPGAGLSAPGVEGDATSDYLGANDRAFTPEDSVVVSTIDEVAEWDVTHSVRWAFANPYYWDFGYVLAAGSEGPGSEKIFHSFQGPYEPPDMNRPCLVITVRAETPVGVPFADAGEMAGYALGPIWPNPTRGPMTFSLSIPREELVTLRLFDVTGRAVATVVDGRLRPGRQEIAWDGRNSAGEEVSPGVFFYRVKAGQFSRVGRVVVLR